MKKTSTINTFEDGLVKDIHPLVSANNVLCNALNATLITMQGNENVLQNDMGNGRVETAFLPEGYVPLGTASIGGIIYILSYNPLNNRCQVGSFPSPERNITSDEISSNVQTLTNEDFQFTTNNGAGIYYLKKELNSDLVFNPGDKFIIYGDTISSNFKKFYDESKYNPEGYLDAQEQTMKISIGAVTDTGKLVVFDQLKKYKVGGSEDEREFQIMQYNPKDGDGGKPDLDSYRSIISQPYNIFSSKISGRLVIIAELIHFDSFSVAIQNNFRTKLSYEWFNNAIYNPNLKVKFSGESPFIPKGVKCIVQLIGNGETLGEQECTSEYWYLTEPSDTNTNYKEYEFTINNFLQDIFLNDGIGPEGNIGYSSFATVWKGIRTLANNHDYFGPSKNITDEFVIKYTIIPYMNWGPVSHLAASGSIDLSKLNSGKIQLTGWKYFRDTSTTSSSIYLRYTIEKYISDYSINNITTNFIRIKGLDDSNKIITDGKELEFVSNLESQDIVAYNGNKSINLYTNDSSNGLLCDQLYLADIKVTLTKAGAEDRVFNFYRFMYTNDVFNQYYQDENISDFKDLKLNLEATTTVECKQNLKSNTPEYSFGLIQPIVDGLTEEQILAQRENIESSLSCEQTISDIRLTTTASINLAENYNLFKLRLSKISLTRNNFKLDVKSTGDSKSEYLRYGAELAVREPSKDNVPEFNPLNKYKIPKYTNLDFSDGVIDHPTFVVANIGSFVNDNFDGNNTYTFVDNLKALFIEKAICTWDSSPETVSLTGVFQPLAYDQETFKSYGLTIDPSETSRYSKWIPNTIIGYGFTVNQIGWIPTSHMTIYNQVYNSNSSDKASIKWLHGERWNGTIPSEFRWNNIMDTVLPNSFINNGKGVDYSKLAEYANNDQARFIIHWHDPQDKGKYPVTICKNTEKVEYTSYALDSPARKRELTRFTLMLKADDDNFYPINFQSMQQYNTTKHPDIVTYYNWFTENIISNKTNNDMLNTFASILNSLYRYKSENIGLKYLPINSVESTKSKNTITANMSFNVNVQNNINILLSDGNQIELSTIIQKFKNSNNLPNQNFPELENNVKCDLIYNSDNSNNPKFNFEYLMDNENFTHKISEYKYNGFAIRDYNGEIKGVIQTFNDPYYPNGPHVSRLYHVTGNNGLYSIQSANNVNLYKFNFKYVKDKNIISRYDPVTLLTNNIDFNQHFEVSSGGRLQLKNITSTDISNDEYKFTIQFPDIDNQPLLGYQGDIKLIDTYTLVETEK